MTRSLRGSRNAARLYAVRIDTTPAFALLVEAGLELLGIPMVTVEDRLHGTVRFEQYFASRAAALALRRELSAALRGWSAGEVWTLRMRSLAPRDWVESWKRGFRTFRASRRIVIKPSWEQYTPRAGESVIEIDPGLSFGTGRHFTTRVCLRFMDAISRIRPGGAFLDIGCGSGILSIAAVRLGFKPVTAIDKDPDAIRVSRENFARNRVEDRVACRAADLGRMRPRRAANVVAANLLAGTLEDHAPAVAAAVSAAPPGVLIISGILSWQYPRVCRVYRALGFVERERRTEGEWTAGWFERGPVRKT